MVTYFLMANPPSGRWQQAALLPATHGDRPRLCVCPWRLTEEGPCGSSGSRASTRAHWRPKWVLRPAAALHKEKDTQAGTRAAPAAGGRLPPSPASPSAVPGDSSPMSPRKAHGLSAHLRSPGLPDPQHCSSPPTPRSARPIQTKEGMRSPEHE